jgi:hypothetical protein
MLDIQEDDLEALKFKLGHRRKLQREIAVSKNIIRLQERLDIDDHPWTEQLAVVERSPLPIRGEKRRKRGHENTGGTSKRYDPLI